jgi:integrase
MRHAEKHRKSPKHPFVYRARYLVDDELQPHLPPPWTGQKAIRKSTGIKVVGCDADEVQRIIDKFGEEVAYPAINAARAALARMRGEPQQEVLRWASMSRPRLDGTTEQIFFPHRLPTEFAVQPAPVPTSTWEPITAERAIAIWTKQAFAPEERAIIHRRNRLNDMLTFVSAQRGVSLLDDITVVTTQEGQAWKEAMEAAHPEPSNVPRGHLDTIKGIYTAVAKQGKFLHLNHGNPFERVYLPKRYAAQATRTDTSEDDVRKLLFAARACGDPNLRWLVELEAYQGGSHSEIADARLKNIVIKDGIACIDITNKGRRFPRADGTTYEPRLKSRQRPRLMPLHPTVRDGLLERVAELRAKYGADAALFEEIEPNPRGRRNKVASDMVLDLLAKVGVGTQTDPETGEVRLNDAYSLRHRFISVLIRTKKISNSAGEQRRYLAGHTGRLPGDEKEPVGGASEGNYAHFAPADLLPIIIAMGDPTAEPEKAAT